MIKPTIEEYGRLSKAFYGSFLRRLLAYSVDLALVSSFASILEALKPTSFEIIGISLYFGLFHVVYFVFCTSFRGQTIGKAIFGLKVESELGGNASFESILFRETIGRIITSVATIVSCLFVIFSKKKQSIHDVVSDTIVVREEMSDLRNRINKSLLEE